ncbi:MAG: prolyl oligopeptidase family serine peptidase [Rhodanobacter sp.]
MGDDSVSLMAHSTPAGIARIRAHLLRIHGGEDRPVPFKDFREFSSAPDRRHIVHETQAEPDEGHGFFIEAHRIKTYRKMVDFRDRNIGSRGDPAVNGDTRTTGRPAR